MQEPCTGLQREEWTQKQRIAAAVVVVYGITARAIRTVNVYGQAGDVHSVRGRRKERSWTGHEDGGERRRGSRTDA